MESRICVEDILAEKESSIRDLCSVSGVESQRIFHCFVKSEPEIIVSLKVSVINQLVCIDSKLHLTLRGDLHELKQRHEILSGGIASSERILKIGMLFKFTIVGLEPQQNVCCYFDYEPPTPNRSVLVENGNFIISLCVLLLQPNVVCIELHVVCIELHVVCIELHVVCLELPVVCTELPVFFAKPLDFSLKPSAACF